jgi:hypothetical protein
MTAAVAIPAVRPRMAVAKARTVARARMAAKARTISLVVGMADAIVISVVVVAPKATPRVSRAAEVEAKATKLRRP